MHLAEHLRRAAPDGLVEVVDRYVRHDLQGLRADALVADYRITGLWPVLRPDDPTAGLLAERGAAARCFGSQDPFVEDVPETPGIRLYVPLTVWGERIGVLVADFPTRPTPATVRRTCDAAEDLAVALRAADRDTDRYRRARRRERLSMAAEMQWDLLPGRCVAHRAFTLAGQLEPAYTVAGDNFDWAVEGDRLTLTVLNGSGEGLLASALTGLAVNAMRNARRSAEGLEEQAELASATVFAAHKGAAPIEALLVELDARTGRVRVVDAGSPRMWRVLGRTVAPVRLEAQLPLGMFEDNRYGTQEFDLAPGDRLFVVSDGVHQAQPAGRSAFGEKGLAGAIRATRLQPAAEAVATVMRGLHEYHARERLDDDAVIVCLDWRGMDTIGAG